MGVVKVDIDQVVKWMVKKKVDERVRGLIEAGVRRHHRSLFLIIGDHGKDQVENLHRILSQTRVAARPSVLWCYKKELGFSTHRQKRMKEIKKLQARGLYDAERDDPFDVFISSTDIRWTYYKETEKILGQTFGMCVLQDFEALTPNILARTVETVEGGGLVILLLKTVKSLKQLYTLTMDVHSRFRTEAHHEIVPRFNERFLLSLSDCQACLVLDDELNILPISSATAQVPRHQPGTAVLDSDVDSSGQALDPELRALQAQLSTTAIVGPLVGQCRTLDQAKAVMAFLDAVSERSLRSTVSLTAARGRGKSAAVGLCLAGAIAQGLSNIYVTAPQAENLFAVFNFLLQGLKALKYTEHLDFEVLRDPASKSVTKVSVFKAHRQSVQYVQPHESERVTQAELLAIDEAAAIPLPVLRSLLGSYIVFLSSTIQGYEGTGRALSLKLLTQLRQQQGAAAAASAAQASSAVSGSKNNKKVHEERWRQAAQAYAAAAGSHTSRSLVELSLAVPIRYGPDDPIEAWLNALLCLDSSSHAQRLVSSLPAPRDCDLYVVDRDALFSYHPLAEKLLQRIWALYTSAHYKNSPNDLQMLSDAPAHRLFALLGPQRGSKGGADQLPDVLCVLQIAFEGRISQKSVASELGKGNKASGDLIPWTVAQQFNDSEFAALSGVRVVRIATHPDVQSMGYGSRALDLLVCYFQGELSVETLLTSAGVFGPESGGNRDPQALRKLHLDPDADLRSETLAVRSSLPPLLSPLMDRPAERLHYIGTSFGLTAQLQSFWARKGFRCLYLRHTANDLTGEHSAILIKELRCDDLADESCPRAGWLRAFEADHRRRLISLLGSSFRGMSVAVGLALVDPDRELTAARDEEEASQIRVADADNDVEIMAKKSGSGAPRQLQASELLNVHMTAHDLRRLEMYGRNLVDHHMVLDLLPTVAMLMFQRRLGRLRLSSLQAAVLVGVGLQRKDVDVLVKELDLPANQVLAFFNKAVRKIISYLKSLVEAEAAAELPAPSSLLQLRQQISSMQSLPQTLAEDQQADELAYKAQKEAKRVLESVGPSVLSQSMEEEGQAGQVDEALKRAAEDGLRKQLQIPKVISAPKAKNSAEKGTGTLGRDMLKETLEQVSAQQRKKQKKRGQDQGPGEKRRRQEG